MIVPLKGLVGAFTVLSSVYTTHTAVKAANQLLAHCNPIKAIYTYQKLQHVVSRKLLLFKM